MRFITCLLLLVLASVDLASAQTAEEICPHDEGGGTVSSKAQVEGVELNFPNEGTINAFVVFVQHFDNSFTTDLTTEWPSPQRTIGADAVRSSILYPASNASGLSSCYEPAGVLDAPSC
ncbi:MAG: hypothetical protein GVY18_10460 [Bacteroidetes bacterium]|jgi:hypothetical protein|nr:hypothetical protein [Bacteroidota bacterium]